MVTGKISLPHPGLLFFIIIKKILLLLWLLVEHMPCQLFYFLFINRLSFSGVGFLLGGKAGVTKFLGSCYEHSYRVTKIFSGLLYL